MSMNVEAEIRDLKRRVSELEGSFGFLMEQVKGVHRSVLTFQERTEERLDKFETDITAIKTDVASVKTDVRGLRKDLPKIVGDAIREVLRPNDR